MQVKKIAADSGYLTGIVYIDAGYNYSLAIDKFGTVWVWGINDSSYRVLGLGDNAGTPQKYAQPVH